MHAIHFITYKKHMVGTCCGLWLTFDEFAHILQDSFNGTGADEATLVNMSKLIPPTHKEL